jgi:two-component system, chemotaxis family, chemotaxis protein CheY
MKALVVDDDNVSRRKVEIILRAYGSVECFGNGTEAIGAFRKALEGGAPFNLVTLDISMPGMNGQQVLKELRTMETEKHVPEEQWGKVIMVTGMADSDTVKFCKVDGCNDFVVKPFSRDIFVGKLRSMGFFPSLRSPL